MGAVFAHQPTTPTANSQAWTSVAYSPTLDRLVAVGFCTGAGTDSHRIMTSDDKGQSWTLRDSGVTGDNVFSDVVWCQEFNGGSGLFAIAVNPNSGTYGNVLVSSDGITWAAKRLPENGAGIDEATVWLGSNTQLNGNWTSFAYDKTLAGNTIHRLTLIGTATGHRLNLFTDNEAVDTGARWYYDNLTPTPQTSTGDWVAATHPGFSSSGGNLTNLAVQRTGATYATSGDVNNWSTTYSVPWTGQPVGPRCLAFGGGRVVCLVNNANATEIWTSDGGSTASGLTWVLRATLATTSRPYQQVVYDSTLGGFVAVGGNKGGNYLIAASTNGTTWVEIDPTQQGFSDETWTSICAIPTTREFVIVGSGGSPHAAITVTWNSIVLSALMPSQGPIAGGQQTAVLGSGLEGCTFTFDGLSATVNRYLPYPIVTTPAHAAGLVAVVATDGINTSTLSNAYIYMNWYALTLPDGTVLHKLSASLPANFLLPFDWFVNGIFYPENTVFSWVLGTTPGDKGWYLAIDDEFAGEAVVVQNTRPKNPRTFTEISSFAKTAASTQWYGGFPGVMTAFNNHLVYAPGEYTVGTDQPTLRVYDGLFDRPIAAVPLTSSSAVPKAAMTMITANGVVYFSTLDSGSSSADWVGRVFSLELESGRVTPIGNALPTGHVPYALCWHAGRLWCGSHRQSSSASGKVFYIRPGIDTDWTADYDVATSSVNNVASLASFNGSLFVGTTGAAATFAKVLVRDTTGAYTTSTTASGGTAAANNGIVALAGFGGKLYASFFNPDSPAVSKIYKFDGSSWSTSYTGASTTLVPFLGFPSDGSTLFIFGGGLGYVATILSTTDGVTWTDRTAFLEQDSPQSTGVPAFGVVVH